jgi:hypothetical protein
MGRSSKTSDIWSLLTTTLLLGQILAHSWNEQLTQIVNGSFAGRNGYSRGYVSRSDPGFEDRMMVYLLPSPDSGRTRIDNTDFCCSPTQRTRNQTKDYPRLQAFPGSSIAIKYLENGHVTLPQNQPGKPPGAGTIYVFGTNQPDDSEILTEVLQWTSDGCGGDRRGRLLMARNFDDNRCYQLNGGNISVTRQQEFPNPVPGTPGVLHEQWCEIDITLPTDIAAGHPFTIYWIWQWPTSPGVPGLPNGKDEYYTSCSDIDIAVGPIEAGPPNPLPNQDPQTLAVTRPIHPGCTGVPLL